MCVVLNTNMGNLMSKFFNYNDFDADNDDYEDECLQSTTIIDASIKTWASKECIKIENLKLLESPELQINVNGFDPRSPNASRTPINVLPSKKRIHSSFGQHTTRKIDLTLDNDADNDVYTNSISINLCNQQLKDKLEKSDTNNLLLDPRSPSQNINRTPIRILKDIDPKRCIKNSDGIFLMKNTMENEKQAEQTKEYGNKLLSKIITLEYKQKMIDPRSPSLNIERTPIALSAINSRNSGSMIEELAIQYNSNIVFTEKLNKEAFAEISTLKSVKTILNYDKHRTKGNKYYCSTPKSTVVGSVSTNAAKKPFSTGLEKTTRTPLRCLSNKHVL